MNRNSTTLLLFMLGLYGWCAIHNDFMHNTILSTYPLHEGAAAVTCVAFASRCTFDFETDWVCHISMTTSKH